jgi:hypothetical protein
MCHWEENSLALLFTRGSVHGLFYGSFLSYNSLRSTSKAIRMCSWVSCFYSLKLFHELCWSSVLDYCYMKSTFPHYKFLQTGRCMFSWAVQMNFQFHLIWNIAPINLISILMESWNILSWDFRSTKDLSM